MSKYLDLSDEALMQKYQQEDYMAFEILYSRHESRVYSYLTKRLTDPSLANEVFQNIFLKLHKQRGKYLKNFLFIQFLYTICRSELLDFFKKKKLDTRPFYEETFVEEFSPAKPFSNIDLKREGSLSENEQKALDLRYYSDADFLEISKILGVSSVNVRKIISRGLRKLKNKYSGGNNE